jgi:hypothetical protein
MARGLSHWNHDPTLERTQGLFFEPNPVAVLIESKPVAVLSEPKPVVVLSEPKPVTVLSEPKPVEAILEACFDNRQNGQRLLGSMTRPTAQPFLKMLLQTRQGLERSKHVCGRDTASHLKAQWQTQDFRPSVEHVNLIIESGLPLGNPTVLREKSEVTLTPTGWLCSGGGSRELARDVLPAPCAPGYPLCARPQHSLQAPRRTPPGSPPARCGVPQMDFPATKSRMTC